MLKSITVILLLISSFASAKAVGSIPENTDEEALDLGVFEFTSSRVPLELRKETSLRFLRKALKEPYSVKVEDWDKMRCWLAQTAGTRFQRLTCGTNRSIELRRLDSKDRARGSAALSNTGSFGDLYVRRLGDNTATLNARMDVLQDNDYFDEEFVTISSNGGTPPKDVPSEEELTQFVNAWFKANALAKANKPEQQLIDAITAESISLKRYNRIVELSGNFRSIQGQIEQIAQNR